MTLRKADLFMRVSSPVSSLWWKTLPGPYLRWASEPGGSPCISCRQTGLDPALTTLKLAEKRGIETVQGIGEKLPFDDGSFGCVLIIVTICFVEDPFKVLIEAKRVLKKDGRIIIGLVPADSPWGAFYHKKKRQGYPFYERSRFYSFDETNKLLEDAGLKITRIRSTLIRRPEQPRQVEEPVEGYVKGAGFLCMEARKKS
jgi:SAM-dependent methyltransferase